MNTFNIENTISYICENKYHYLMSLENVIGIGFGTRYVNNKNTKKPCIKVLVEKKINRNFINSYNIIPKFYKGIRTDVVEVGHISSSSNRIRPLEGGYSIGPADGSQETGTLGCIVYRNIPNNERLFFVLSNNHVLARNNIVKKGTPVIQPSELDGGVLSHDLIGKLYDFIPIKFQTLFSTPSNYVDCAIAKLTNSSLASTRIRYAGNLHGLTKAKVGMNILSSSRTSAQQFGIITSISTTIKVAFAHGTKKALFKRQITSDIACIEGDSGSILLDLNCNAIGLNFAGSSSFCVSNDISMILLGLNVNLYT